MSQKCLVQWTTVFLCLLITQIHVTAQIVSFVHGLINFLLIITTIKTSLNIFCILSAIYSHWSKNQRISQINNASRKIKEIKDIHVTTGVTYS